MILNHFCPAGPKARANIIGSDPMIFIIVSVVDFSETILDVTETYFCSFYLILIHKIIHLILDFFLCLHIKYIILFFSFKNNLKLNTTNI